MILSTTDIPATISFILLLFAPGALFCRLLVPESTLAWSVRITLWIGMSITILALCYEWLTIFKLALHPPIPLLGVVACCLCLAGSVWRNRRQIRPTRLDSWRLGPLVLVVILLLTFGLRLYQARDLALPAWVDGLHHALLIRVAAETGQVPLSLRPYLPVDQLPFHWGYHTFTAFALQVAGVPILSTLPNAILLQGQILNALTTLTYAGLAQWLLRRPLAGITAAVVVGLVSIMPAYYLSWGRYTLLAGVLVLPAAMIAFQLALQHRTWRSVCAAAMVLAGLSMIHFVLFVFAGVWFAVLSLGWSVDPQHMALGDSKRTQSSGAWWKASEVTVLVQVGILALVLALPWLVVIVSRAQIGAGASGTYIAGNNSYNAMPTDLLWAANNRVLLALAGCGVLLGLFRRARIVALLIIWSFLIILLANPLLFGLPYLSFITNETLAATLFIPCALLIAAGVAYGAGWIQPILPHWWPNLVASVLIVIGLWSGWNMRDVVRADTILATTSDRMAISWASTHLSADARVLVNTVGWLADVDRGSDGGWWLLPLAGRMVSTPPVVYTYASRTDVMAIQRLTSHLRGLGGLDAGQVADLMQAEGYGYVYATEGGRQFDAARLRDSSRFEVLYHNDRVTILRLR